MAYLCPVGTSPIVDANGAPLSGGKIYTYLAGTSTPAPTYTDSGGLVQQQNPITLNARGMPDDPIWLAGGVAMKLVVTDSSLVTLPPTFDNILGINDPSGVTAQDQWVQYTGTPTYIGATSFSVAGDQTGTFQVGRRLKTANSGGTIYSTVVTSVFGALTTVTVVNDSGTLDSGLSAVSYGLLSYSNTSVPRRTGELIGAQIFTVTGVYTPSFGTNSVVVEVQAPGGGSGGCVATTAGQWAAGRSGGGGGYGRKRITSAFSGVTVTIGAVGAAGAAGNNAGTTGGTTSFGALISCTGGEGGGGSGAIQTVAGFPGATGSSSTAAGGTATLSDYQRPGSAAGVSFAVSSASAMRGAGGDSYYGSGGPAGYAGGAQLIAAAGSGYGGGASAPVNCNAIASAAGGAAGAPGIVIVWEYA